GPWWWVTGFCSTPRTAPRSRFAARPTCSCASATSTPWPPSAWTTARPVCTCDGVLTARSCARAKREIWTDLPLIRSGRRGDQSTVHPTRESQVRARERGRKAMPQGDITRSNRDNQLPKQNRRVGRPDEVGDPDLVRFYLDEIGMTPLLTAEQEVELS